MSPTEPWEASWSRGGLEREAARAGWRGGQGGQRACGWLAPLPGGVSRGGKEGGAQLREHEVGLGWGSVASEHHGPQKLLEEEGEAVCMLGLWCRGASGAAHVSIFQE